MFAGKQCKLAIMKTSIAKTQYALTAYDLQTLLALVRGDHLVNEIKLAKLAGLRPIHGPGGVITAGNSSPLNDGAAAVVVVSERYAAAHGEPLRMSGGEQLIDLVYVDDVVDAYVAEQAQQRRATGAEMVRVLRKEKDDYAQERAGRESDEGASGEERDDRSERRGDDPELPGRGDRDPEVVGHVAQDRREHEHARLAREEREEEDERWRRAHPEPARSRGRRRQQDRDRFGHARTFVTPGGLCDAAGTSPAGGKPNRADYTRRP